MKRVILPVLVVALLFSGCGFARNPRLCQGYLDNAISESPGMNLAIWPIHVIALAFCGTIDQLIATFEIFPPAGTDAYDYLILQGNGNNITFERTIALPKTAATPVIFIISYLMRWLLPIEHKQRPFQMDLPCESSDIWYTLTNPTGPLFPVVQDGKWGYIDKTGKYIWKPTK